MWKNYLKIALRSLRQNKGYTSINIIGLAVGMAACLLIALYVRHELSYDDFHRNADRIHRITQWWTQADETRHFAATPSPLASAVKQELPYVQEAMRMELVGGPFYPLLVTHEDNTFEEERFYKTDASFFDIFSFELLSGNRQTVLNEPNTVVVTETTAQRYFGEDDPLGKVIDVEGDAAYRVVGVVQDPPPTSHFQFDFLAPLTVGEEHWGRSSYNTFILLQPGISSDRVEKDLARIAETHRGNEVRDYQLKYTLQPLTTIHLSRLTENGLEQSRHHTLLYVLAVVALLILLIACINYVNLATAHSLQRAEEVGVRKALGAHRMQVTRQFLGESLLVCLLAFAMAVALAWLAQPLYGLVAGQELTFSITGDRHFLILGVGVVLLVGVLGGSYPAFLLSTQRPDEVLRGKNPSAGRPGLLRNGLMVTQFAASVALIICTGVVYYQLTYLRTTDLGFDVERIIVVELQDEAVRSQMEAFRAELLRHPNVLNATASSGVPSRVGISSLATRWGSEEEIRTAEVYAGSDFAETYGLELAEGELPQESFAESPWDPSSGERRLLNSSLLVNEAFVRQMDLDEPVGQKIEISPFPGRIVGVVANFHFESLREKIGPVVLMYHPYMAQEANRFFSRLSVRVRPEDIPRTLTHLQQTYESFSTGRSFKYHFLEDRFDELYRSEARLASIFGAFAVLTLVIACMGLFALAAYAAERRTKEISIRKVCGASTSNIVALLSKDFAWLVLTAIVIAAPIAYYAMSQWLQDFAYRIELGPWLFVGAGVLALVIAMVTVSYQTMRAALSNPADTLRYE